MSTILAASASEPNLWATAQRATSVVATTAYMPTRQLVQRLQRTLASLHLFILWCQLSSTIGSRLLSLLAQPAAVNKPTILASATRTRPSIGVRRLSEAGAWGSKTALSWRRRATMELAWAILSPAGNAVCLLLFWPGWWVLGVCVYATWWSCGR
ncbi:hypothetical protein MCOR07_007551 [Pyricularia oryzae]|uniref:Uncharacterized protein n=1 Tax=Pyricularia grisea TaxID=148305 RepID=A0ABQ8NRJ5_PYRGI|nr:hypothetical protein MCOR19_001402 [Pyricularia oryzae]KAI6301102.1 hypothetical protein MCOR33_003285 [Pyricularia grisea]KAI6273586.1 hypothetical protein MCOR26_006831 [Pyricularia oryzae]KAI6339446.1 hypothetical protein MCOR28_007278 [Pyricularia oryzae]KAI6381194.1 hypothetical protein MCOR32_003650 [Pyricularia oryzae]